MAMENVRYVLGVDYGTDSVRALVVDAKTGKEESSEVAYYPRWAAGKFCNPAKNQFRQHPLDYIEGLESAIKGALKKIGPDAGAKVIGIGIDTTGSTPCAVDQTGQPLAMRPEFAENPNGMFILWKDHTAVMEAAEINETARNWEGVNYLRYVGGIYSSEWYWAKILHVLREDSSIRDAAYSWVEHCDWIPALLTGTQEPTALRRSRCAAGHKALWHSEWDGLPDEEFLVRLDPLLKGLRDRLFKETFTSDQKAGELTTEWARRLGLRPGIAVAVGAFDCHMGAVGGRVTEGALVKIMGTSTCDVMISSKEAIGDKLISGICGQVDGSVIPGMIGLEAGQSAYGDVYAWFKNIMSWPLKELLPKSTLIDSETSEKIKEELMAEILPRLTEEAAGLSLEETGLIALDWLNGRRTPDADQSLRGAIIGLSLGTTPGKIFRALVEATAFGAKAIVERFIQEGVAINEIIAMGGIAKKSEFVMQVTADVLGMPIKVVQSEQACALGASIFGAVAAGVYDSVEGALDNMASPFSKVYQPAPERAQAYRRIYRQYMQLGQSLEQQLRNLA
jgi:L-ribulokinase